MHLEMPQDVGLTWALVHDDQRALVSEAAAYVLAGRYGVPVDGEPRSSFEYAASTIGSDYRLSKKARDMLNRHGFVVKGGS